MRKLIYSVVFAALTGLLNAMPVQDNRFTIDGRVSDKEGNALAGASVAIEGTVTGILTDSGGKYSFSGLKAGVYKFRFSFIGCETKIRDVNLDRDKTINITLEPQAVLTKDVLVMANRAGEHSPLAYSDIGRELLKKQNTGYDLPYIISLTPSLIETSEAGNGVGYTGLRIRGTDGNRINVTIDGIPLNDPESQQVFWVDLPNLAASVENIQVQRGAGTSSNGAGAFGATISIQTSNPENEPFAEISTSAG
jgi:iron complex outermembrane receptor protein